MRRKTIQEEISYEGVGLHKGNVVNLTLKPYNNGIIFKRVDIKNNNVVKVDVNNVFDLERGTNIKNEHDISIHTIEHLLSVLYIFEITDVMIEINGTELPIGDGSGKIFYDLLEKAGSKELNAEIGVLKIKEPLYVSQGEKHLIILPYDGYKITYGVNYNHNFLKAQLKEVEINRDSYKKNILCARTFCFDYEIDYMKKNNLALGGNLNNAIVIAKDGVLNREGLRSEEEFVEHKILDLIGDLKVLNRKIEGHVLAIKSGHYLNNELAKKIFKLYMKEE